MELNALEQLIGHHIQSYNDLVVNRIAYVMQNIGIRIIKAISATRPRHDIAVFVGGADGKRHRLQHPTYLDNGVTKPLTPAVARLRNLNYSARLVADVVLEYTTYHAQTGAMTRASSVIPDVEIGMIPIMVGSRACILHGKSAREVRQLGCCPYADVGGFFIVGGREKVIIGQERIAKNRLFVTRPIGRTVESAIRTGKPVLEGMIQCTIEDDAFTKTNMLVLNPPAGVRYPNALRLRVPGITGDSPIALIFRAIGVESDREIVHHIVGVTDFASATQEQQQLMQLLYWSLAENEDSVYTQERALDALKERVAYRNIDQVRHILVFDVMRHERSMHRKAVALGLAAQRMLRTALGFLPLENRDSFLHKRIDTSGELVYRIFRDFYNRFAKLAKNRIDAIYISGSWASGSQPIELLIKQSNASTLFDASIITAAMHGSLRGNWMLENDPNQAGIVQELNRASFVGYLSHLRRTSNPLRYLKLAAPRRLDGTQWGYMCSTQSPDGSYIGLDKHLASTAVITADVDPTALLQLLDASGVQRVDDCGLQSILTASGPGSQRTRVLVNDRLYGLHDQPVALKRRLREERRKGNLHREISVFTNSSNELCIACDGGRIARPLAVIHDGKGADAELIDVEESGDCMVAMTREDITSRHTHLEVVSTAGLGAFMGTVPFAEHNFAPRNYFAAAQAKQAIGVYATNFDERFDTVSYVLANPQRPIVTTDVGEAMLAGKLPNGQNLIVAVASFSGYNQEDSVLINRSAVERGMLAATFYYTLYDRETREGGGSTMLCDVHSLADKLGFRCKRANVAPSDQNGLPKVNAYIAQGDLLVGKLGIAPNGELRDESMIADKTLEGANVDRVFVFNDDQGLRGVKIRMRCFRPPVLGDKVASRHSQKGVIGAVVDACDMPFTASGIVPDIVINPHAFPKRMTVGHFIEMLAGKTGCAKCASIDGTPHGTSSATVESLADGLRSNGFHGLGEELMYDGRSGQQHMCPTFMGVGYYYRMKHVVADKINYRSNDGKIDKLTHQPARGRAVDGGLKIGEMERDSLISNGLSGFTKEAFYDKADKQHTLNVLWHEIAALGVNVEVSR